ncbi:hypothetical protein NM213_09675 [Pseudomonas lactis]|uniref:Uncharacterized protein n=1 Tax=Pseudomonas lactis TaxID=1615674 RepID=A0ABS9FNY0_9PSED|nr:MULTISPECIES: hypothetical protein [Pseudomonas]MBI6975912.1 hypothetical protein [Pseudomonas lactis]MCF4974727.1 hypothetical protein [Pseudomonas lactis]MCF5002239.1 hypothetical protein [Pseudomonas lactis]MCF5007870.1 hypothetical protein [Pseudomonas lactis]MCF5014079.1 hypothetical protein [Pseudomonas lactis]
MKKTEMPGWITRGKTISELIEELRSFEDQNLMVEISVDGGVSKKPISLVGKEDGVCVLFNCESDF